ncbi:MAG: pyruvate, phosphate dikinase [Eubacteriales bacterium]|nr:pyruvate, phosphate dikinase [Eubacteriales bacterium]
MSKKYVYLFSEGNESMRGILGGKGANLAEMTNLGMPVPQGFTVSTEACMKYYENNESVSPELIGDIYTYMIQMEEMTGKQFGCPENPLLVSVRSGARASMPGMMDTILNLGLNDLVVEGLAKLTGNSRFAYDSYRRFIQMFSDVVMGVPKSEFEQIIDCLKTKKGKHQDIELDEADMKHILKEFKKLYFRHMGSDFPQEPKTQLIEAIKAVFRSWNNERAVIYRRMNDIPSSWGTAVNVQSMVFGNMGATSGTGVAFTRDPSTGEKKLYGEFLMNAQGEDVVAGIRTPQPISELAAAMPEAYEQFLKIADTLEKHYRDMQDMEFTIENGKLYMLQTRNGKRTAAAALRIAVDLVDEGMITEDEAIMKVEPKQLDSLLHPQFDIISLKQAKPISSGLPASPGAACGRVYFTAEDAKKAGERGEKVILVRLETSPEDIEGMYVSEGILTGRGGRTSHAAVVARGMGRCCVAGCGAMKVKECEKCFIIDNHVVHEGDYISIDGSTGNIYIDVIKTVPAGISGDFARFMSWADKKRRLKVRTNADNPKDTEQAVAFGAEGVGLCRTEHMFFVNDRIHAMREMIVSRTAVQRKKALDKLLPMQKSDFTGIFRAARGYPVTIRFLDPPLHEFLPCDKEEIEAIAVSMGMTYDELNTVVVSLHESNPMMGHRGCRLAVSYPEIYEMQTKAVIEAALEVNLNDSMSVEPEIMIPLVGDVNELRYVKKIVTQTADKIIATSGMKLSYKVGTMIEIPRAAVMADEIATEAEFFSFGTNDLTQMAFGFSRDDASKFLDDYYAKGIFESDPFARLDTAGVGKFIKLASDLGRTTRPDIKLGICGEHGGDPSSVEFCHNAGLTYVSCSPFRVPIARLAAAQAAIKSEKAK